MKKMVKRALALGICVMLILSSVVFASAASATFFTKTIGSHSCTGRGTISSTQGQGIFNATALPGKPIFPDTAYESLVWVFAYSSAGTLLGGAYETENTTSLVATYSSDSGSLALIRCWFRFEGEDLGAYYLYK